MHRIVTVLAAVLAATLLSAAPAWSVPRSASLAVVSATPTRVVYVMPCVTTTWRSAYWRLGKTPVGSRCYATPDMWIPRAWPVVGRAKAGGVWRPVYLRTM